MECTRCSHSVSVDKVDAMLGSYGPKPDVRVTVVQDEFPSGMLARATYHVKSRVVDFDGVVYGGKLFRRAT